MEFRCGRCGELKGLGDFNSSSSRKSSSYCKPCQKEFAKEHYRKNRPRYIARNANRRKREYERLTRLLAEYLSQHPCVDCGEANILVLDFDHLRDKSFDISRGIRSLSWERILEEIEKCEVVCGNCHRRRTAQRGNHARHRFGRLPRQGRLLIDPE